MSRVIVFDVNETLLDLRALDPWFQTTFGDASVRALWFGQLLQSALVSTVTDEYADFGTVGRAALDMTAERRGRHVGESEARELFEAMRSLPPHSDVKPALGELANAGIRLATLTNSRQDFATAQLTNAGIRDSFERILSADQVRRLKPAREPYEMAARELGVPVSDIVLVAAHAWDVTGALRAGAHAAFVERPGMVLDPLAPTPDIVGRGLGDVAAQLLGGGPAS